MRKDFAQKDKVKLAQRCGYICSYPSCEAVTIAPSEEGDNKTSSIGMACHIYSASDGTNAKRINTEMTDEQLSDISNGIWMCYTHGKLIDTDEVRFTADLLKEWKRINESIASFRQETGLGYQAAFKNISLNKLVENEVNLPKEFAINRLVGEALHDSCLSVSWGSEITETIRDFLVEHIRNAYSHGDSDGCTLKINACEIIVIDNGTEFDVRSLYNAETGQGGTLSIRRLLDHYGEKIFLSSYRLEEENILKISLPKTSKSITSSTPCVVNFDMNSLHQGNYSYHLNEFCNEVFIILPEYFGLSDIAFISTKHPALLSEKRHLIFVLQHVSEHVKELLLEQFKDCQFMVLNDYA
ncbi:hypothetical protein FMZ60_05445 [Alcaligenaceae bacterium SJ-26]|nr:hypothetical protein FMZ60_05445 [Alcaligenaceae bacterium SJ-26]